VEVIGVPYHLDEYLPDLDLPLRPDAMVTVAEGPAVVESGDCTTASGYLGGLPLRLLAGYRPELIAGQLGLRPVAERRILLVGARDLDPPEVTYLAGAQIGRCEVRDLAARQVAPHLSEALTGAGRA
jgi:arginase